MHVLLHDPVNMVNGKIEEVYEPKTIENIKERTQKVFFNDFKLKLSHKRLLKNHDRRHAT